MANELAFPPDLETTELAADIERSLAKARARAAALDKFAEQVGERLATNKVIIDHLESSLAEAQGPASAKAKAKANGGAKTEPKTEAKPGQRPATKRQRKAVKRPRTAETPAQELLLRCGPRAFDIMLAWARERQEFAPDEFVPPEGMTVTQSRTAQRALLADGALVEDAETGRRRFVREPTFRSIHQRVLDHLTESGGSSTQPKLITALNSNQSRISTAVRELVADHKVTNTPQGTGTTKLVALVGTPEVGTPDGGW